MRLLVGGCWVEVGRRLRRRLKKHPVRFDSASFNEREDRQTEEVRKRKREKREKKKKRKEKKRKRVIEEARETDRRMQIQYVLCRQHNTKKQIEDNGNVNSAMQTRQAGLSLNRGRSFQIEDCPSWGI